MAVNASNTFAAALCDHFGLPKDQVMADININARRDDLFSATLTIALTPEDLEGIAARMKGENSGPTIPNEKEIKALIAECVREHNAQLADALRRGWAL